MYPSFPKPIEDLWKTCYKRNYFPPRYEFSPAVSEEKKNSSHKKELFYPIGMNLPLLPQQPLPCADKFCVLLEQPLFRFYTAPHHFGSGI
jgi:hypothetical protein